MRLFWPSPQLNPFFSYYGAGFRKCRKGFYPAPRSFDRCIVELFAGSAAYACTFGANKKCILIEKDEKVASIWRYLIRVSPEEVLSLPDIPFGQNLEEVKGIPYEAKNLISFWLSRSTTTGRNILSKWAFQYPHKDGCFWSPKVRKKIAGQLQYIRKWEIRNQSCFDFSWEEQDSTVVVDPPYFKGGKHYREHPPNQIKEVWYKELGDLCKRFANKGMQVIVWEQEGATWLPFDFAGEVKTLEGKNGKKKSREVCWIRNKE